MTCTYENGIMNAEVIGMFKINPYRPGAGLMPTYLAGRDADMDAIRDLLDALKLGIPTQSVIFSGLRGVGKTVLINKLQEIAEEKGIFCKHIEVEERKDFISQIASCSQAFLRQISTAEKFKSLIQKPLDAIKSLIVSFDPDGNTFSLSLQERELYRTSNLTQSLTDVFTALGETAYKTESPLCFFIDEIQLMDKFEDVVNGIKTDFNCDLYITGSNSKLLSSEINTKLRGRGIEIKVYPLSFKEFYDGKTDKNTAFNEYIKYGGLPYINSLDKEYEKHEYLKMINDTVATKDIIDRNKIRNEEVFNAVIDLLCSQIGCYVSPNKIANTLVSNGFKTVDNDTVSNYLKYLCDAFLFYKAVRYDLKGKEYLKTLNKYYICDLGLRNQRLGYRQMEMTHIIENIVYLELLRRNYQVDIGKNKESEIDFVVRSHDDLYYIQVSLSIENESTRMREENAFKGLDDGYKKIIITMDNNPLIHLERGYKMLNLFDFLLNENILKSI